MTRKLWLIIATSFVLMGCVIFGFVMMSFQWDFSKLSTVKYETNDYDIDENYKNIKIITDTADIVFAASENGKSSVVCYEQKNVKHSVAIKNDTLVIEVFDTRKWYEHIGVFFCVPQITVYIPQGEYGVLSVKSSTGDVEIPSDFKFKSIDISESTGDVTNYASVSETMKIKTSTGKIHTQDIAAGIVDLTVSTGKVTVTGVTCEGDVQINVSTGKTDITELKCKNLISKGSTGDISLQNVVAVEKFSIQRSTGDVMFEKCDAVDIFVKTDTGRITGTLLSEKMFITNTDTGSVNVPKTVTGGRCEMITDTGDIKITIN